MLRFALPFLTGLAIVFHTHLARSEPAARSTVPASPAELRLWFEGGAEDAFTRVRLKSAAGVQLALGKPSRGQEPGLVVATVPVKLAPGPYIVEWETVGRDGHPVRGSFTFAVEGDTAARGAPAAPGTGIAVDTSAFGAGAAGRTAVGAPLVADEEGARYSALTRPVRWLELSALVLAIGAVTTLLVAIVGSDPAGAVGTVSAIRRRMMATVGIATVAYLAFTAARLALESQAMHGPAAGLSLAGMRAVIGTSWGGGWLVGVGAAATMLLGLFSIGVGGRGGMLALALAAMMLAVSPALSGHAVGDTSYPVLAVVTDWIHVLGASGWIGGVFALGLAALPVILRADPLHRAGGAAWLIMRFHRLATPSLVLVLLSGMVSSWLRVGGWDALTATNYGDVLLFKVFVVVFAALLGAWHWKRARPRLLAVRGDDPRELRRLRSTMLLELLVGVVVLLLTAVLVTTQSPR